MTDTRALTILILACVSASAGLAAETRFEECFLVEGADGSVRLGDPIAFLGMWGRMAGIVEEKLHPEIAKKFAPLVCRSEALARSPEPEYDYLDFLARSEARAAEVPRILVGIEFSRRLLEEKESPEPGLRAVPEFGVPHLVYEIDSVRLKWAETQAARGSRGERRPRALRDAFECGNYARIPRDGAGDRREGSGGEHL